MPLTYQIEKSRRLVFTTATGTLTSDELLNHQNTVLSDPDFDRSFSQLHDVRMADLAQIHPDCVQALALHVVPKRGARKAIVVASQMAHGLARMFERLREGTGEQIQIFRDFDSARTWLGGVPVDSKDDSIERPQERRAAPRKQLRMSVVLRSGVQERSAQVVNISLSGVLLDCPVIYPDLGAPIKLHFGPPEVDPPVDLKGAIVRHTETGFAVHFAASPKEPRDLVWMAASTRD